MGYRLAGTVVGALTASFAFTQLAQAEDLIYASPLPPKHVVNLNGIVPLIKTLKGKVPMQLIAGGQIFGFKAALTSVGNRSADATLVVPAYFQSKLPNASIPFGSVFLGAHQLVSHGAAEELLMIGCPECKADFTRSKTVYLGGYATGGMAFLCNKPVTKIADLKGLKVRTSGSLGRWAARFGSIPVTMSPGDMIQAINRGQIDCIAGFDAWYKSYPVRDAVKWILSYPMGTPAAVGFMVMNLRTWKRMKLAQKKALFAALPQTSANISGGYIVEATLAIELAKKNKVTITKSGAALEKIWAAHKKTEYAAILAAAKKVGSKNPKKVLDLYVKMLAKWDGIIKKADLWDFRPGSDNPPKDVKAATKKFADLLHEHIYSKIDPAKY